MQCQLGGLPAALGRFIFMQRCFQPLVQLHSLLARVGFAICKRSCSVCCMLGHVQFTCLLAALDITDPLRAFAGPSDFEHVAYIGHLTCCRGTNGPATTTVFVLQWV